MPSAMGKRDVGSDAPARVSLFFYILLFLQDLLTTDSEYHSLSRTAAKIINEFTGLNLRITDEKEDEIDLCKAWEEQRKEDIETGMKEGRLDSIKRMLDKGISEEQVKELLDATDDEIEQAKEREES